MRINSFLLALCGILFTAVFAAANFEGMPFEVTKIRISQGLDMTAIRFTVRDPEPLEDVTAVCAGSWKTNSTDWQVDGFAYCLGNTTLAWNIQSFISIREFSLEVQHSFSDPAIGKPPYDRVRNFAIGYFNETMEEVQCTSQSCRQVEDTTIFAPIHASIAKRR